MSNVHLSLEHISWNPSFTAMASTFQWTSDSQQITVSVMGSNAVKSLFQGALQSQALLPTSSIQTIVYADGTVRDANADPIKYYVSSGTHMIASSGGGSGASLKSYLREYLYENLSSAIGLAATTGDIDIAFAQDGVAADETISAAIAEQICLLTAQGVRKSLYDQMLAAAPDRFSSSGSGGPLPFQANDTLAVRIAFKFPAGLIQTPVAQSILRVKNSSLFVSTGNKIQVTRPVAVPQLNDFPDCTVQLCVRLAASN